MGALLHWWGGGGGIFICNDGCVSYESIFYDAVCFGKGVLGKGNAF